MAKDKDQYTAGCSSHYKTARYLKLFTEYNADFCVAEHLIRHFFINTFMAQMLAESTAFSFWSLEIL